MNMIPSILTPRSFNDEERAVKQRCINEVDSNFESGEDFDGMWTVGMVMSMAEVFGHDIDRKGAARVADAVNEHVCYLVESVERA